MTALPPAPPPARWAVPLAFTLVYLCWGTTFLAIRVGVEHFPPGLFGGTRVGLAGLLILTYLGWRGEPVRLPRREFLWAGGIGLILFIGGNLMITVAEKYVVSSVAAVLAATSPLWMALLEMLWPWGERLTVRGWAGLLAGFGGVVIVFIPKLSDAPDFSAADAGSLLGLATAFSWAVRSFLTADVGPLLVLASAFSWAVGSFLLRRQRGRSAHLTAAAYQMVVGGLGQCLVGLAMGEVRQLGTMEITAAGIYAFFHLLVFGSLVGFVSYTWLLGHVSVTQAGTYAYVTPVLAILVGGWIGNETITGWIVGGMACILGGVALLRTGGIRMPEMATKERIARPRSGKWSWVRRP